MLLTWLKAKDAVEAGSALADTFPPNAAANAVGDFLRRASQELRERKLGFYERARFANAFKWRLLENGVAAETVRKLTQTLLVSASSPRGAAPATPVAASAAAPDTRKGPIDRSALETLFRQAEEAFARGECEKAIALYEEYLDSRPRDTAALNNLAVAYIKLGRHAQAEALLRKATARNPKNVDAHVNLGNALYQRGYFYDAETSFRRVISLKPTDLSAHINLGQTLVLTGDLDGARSEFEHVLKQSPHDTDALAGLGSLERARGNFAEAETMYRRALEADPNRVSAWVSLAGLRRMTQGDSQWLAGAQKAAANTESATEKAAIQFAIGKYFEDLGQHSQALDNYQRANSLMKPLARPYVSQARNLFVTDMTKVYTSEAIAAMKGGSSSATRKVFVIGMPRSGMALAEQILASHPSVSGVGELDFWYEVVRNDEASVRRAVLPQQSRQKIASEYLATLKSRAPKAAHTVDRTAVNADFVGLIHSVFPDARFIYMRRDPVDTCLSCYFQNFPPALNYSFDLGDLAHYYSEHARLMAHWREVLPPGTLLNVEYEDLVANQEQVTRRMLDFVGLEWDERCLKFNETPQPVTNSGAWQLRQPIFGDSVGRSRHYTKLVAPLRTLEKA